MYTRKSGVGILLILIAVLLFSLQWKSTIIKYSSLTAIEIDAQLAVSDSRRRKQFIVFVIPTMPEDTDIRNLFRSTWMNLTAWGKELQGIDSQFLKFKVMFILGEEKDKTTSSRVSKEMVNNEDMFLFRGEEEHRIVLKYKVLWGMSVASAFFDYSYLVKIDTDTFVDLPKLIKGLMGYRRTDAYTGHCKLKLGGYDAQTIPRADQYKYCSGGGYIVSRDLVDKTRQLDPSIHDTHIVPEDGYIGWLLFHVQQNRGKENSGSSIEIPQERDDVTYMYHKKGVFTFNHWFQHRIKSLKEMSDMYEARLSGTMKP